MAPKKNTTKNERLAARTQKLEDTANRACAIIHDGSNNVARAIALAARSGMPRATADQVVEALRAAVADVQAVVEHAYTPGAGPAQTAAGRVKLS